MRQCEYWIVRESVRHRGTGTQSLPARQTTNRATASRNQMATIQALRRLELRISVRPKPYLCPTTEGFYDTASRRSQQASQHQTVYQKETTLPKRRCPRRGKPKHVTEAIKRGKPNNALIAKPRPCVKTMLSVTASHGPTPESDECIYSSGH